MFPCASPLAALPLAAGGETADLSATITIALGHGAAGIRRSEPAGVIALEDADWVTLEVIGNDIELEVNDTELEVL
jgi:hypothetical protein